MDILDEFLDRFAKDGAFLGGERVLVGLGKVRDFGGSFRLLALAIVCLLVA